jgi:hypothetical protein
VSGSKVLLKTLAREEILKINGTGDWRASVAAGIEKALKHEKQRGVGWGIREPRDIMMS